MTLTRPIRHYLILLLLPFTLLMGGCFEGLLGTSSSKTVVEPVGVYKSADRGDTWATSNLILTTSGQSRPTLNDTNVQTLVMDPTDRQTLYLGSQGQGLFYTYDSAQRWWQSGPIRSGTINDIAVPYNPNERCTVYAATVNRILKTTDCGRFWQQPYFDTRKDTSVLSLEINHQQAAVVLAGTSTGEILKSDDAGQSWETVARLGGAVNRIVGHNINPSVFYAVVAKKGIWKTIDGGATWQDVSDGLKEFSGAKDVSAIVVDPMHPDTMVAASKYGLVRTTDAGVTWAALQLLTPPGKVVISDVAMNPQNASELYYTTTTTLYRSNDAGATWETRPLPAPNTMTKLLVDPKLGSTLYLGVLRVQNTNGGSLIGF
ncbi:hypothetical protein COV04_03720 [Candidatus Uhrbacteria bacterium CG10_big_fil_rev_8_21_14_0_10_48_11]|uniref:Photosynthesis system II assembly factor Ycf48/Hcf136-like domain-containing protein n=1 Tax=Candidatus Uhrbacteria bacterium CG10_big_fil_rev_8_21_14_0_10_48_11 TaxID=1975037 RepID=A0A2M8LE01_9BACT|nr:MAG: hypothetical protein COV04_03720 [Candidatus Uhrbacteria bacterium CG10_big_fil_rev_8_21_14_0_10_48_11]